MSAAPTPPNTQGCPAEETLKLVSGKWKAMILKLAVDAPLRFNTLLKQLPGSNKESLSNALKDLEEAGVLLKETIQLKPLHIEYRLSEKGQSIIPVLRSIEALAESNNSAGS
ncbi:helix-turn-helix domain-containing protein [Ferruginibacter sp. HRS2-29]|uniref:winged helix-turn-helix transcriptional regulator n=1 Tax=Ferruginibacter sp. HRS2-29 TaxID=2487334 RepID=UPI0020CF408B|nr:helix-turn-helix domain-containing protein [Ferruginibacter sp. HRS2-29]MCP9750380.1 transcriptional regulator [Ferruginibacter sp. HRS2-29]